jgi:hypothetical protein
MSDVITVEINREDIIEAVKRMKTKTGKPLWRICLRQHPRTMCQVSKRRGQTTRQGE